MRIFAAAMLAASAAFAALIPDVRAALSENDFAKAEALIQQYKSASGVTPEMLEAHSWLGRGALKNKSWDKADAYARETYKLALVQLAKQKDLDQERHLPIALGASIEVQAQTMGGRGMRDQGVAFLRKELVTYAKSSMRMRIQKNIHMLSLEGKAAPEIRFAKHLGPKPSTLAALKGKPVVLFFWAHWCGDCKYQGPILAKLKGEYKDLVVMGPTQHYGYVARGEDAAPPEEEKYIGEVLARSYADLADMPVPLDDETFRQYGCSTTPTLVLVDRAGVVRLYHPGVMKEEELRPVLDKFAK